MDRIWNGYDIVDREIRKYWRTNGVSDVVVLLRLDEYPDEVIAFCESDNNYEKVTYNSDFWEGEQNIEIELIKPLWEVLLFYRDYVKKEANNE